MGPGDTAERATAALRRVRVRLHRQARRCRRAHRAPPLPSLAPSSARGASVPFCAWSWPRNFLGEKKQFPLRPPPPPLRLLPPAITTPSPRRSSRLNGPRLAREGQQPNTSSSVPERFAFAASPAPLTAPPCGMIRRHNRGLRAARRYATNARRDQPPTATRTCLHSAAAQLRGSRM